MAYQPGSLPEVYRPKTGNLILG